MFDRLIANNRKAQRWTMFWVIALCVMAAAVLWMAYDISKKKNHHRPGTGDTDPGRIPAYQEPPHRLTCQQLQCG